MSINRILPTDTNLGDILSNVLPAPGTVGMAGSAASVAAMLGAGLGVGPIGSKPGDPSNIMNNGNSSNGNGNSGPPGIIGGMSNSSMNSCSSSNALGMSNNSNGIVDGMGGFLGGLPDFTDVLRNSCRSPPEHQQHQGSNNHGNGGGVPFGTQSFASAVSSYSGVAAAGGILSADGRSSNNNSNSSNNNSASMGSSGMLNHQQHQHHHSGKFFDNKGSLLRQGNGGVPGSYDMVGGGLMNGPVGSSWKASGNNGTLGNQSLYDNIDNAFSLGFPLALEDRDYSLFPSAGLSKFCLEIR